MKTAIYIENNRMQFVLTAETEIDKKVLEQLRDVRGLQTFKGSFYDCHGGYIRQGSGFGEWNDRDDSLIFLVEEKKPEIAAQPHG